MTLVRKNQNWLPSIFNDFMNDNMLSTMNQFAGNTVPAINVKENETAYTVEVAAPGMTREDFDVRIDKDNDLVISLERKNAEETHEGERFLRREFSYSKFQQTMILPDDVDKERISAKVENGILSIELPKLTNEQIQKAQRCITIQ
ncbi:MAG: Hsp20/alpha crystallin family protein [Paludibacteraceae bacterium]|nr:Hsp20/alpha crystallin family protein [Paludibacteraceae bacterium]